MSQLPLRFITAASLFDGHDVAINIMRRILQASGVEVIHLGHNRSVIEVVEAAIQEDVHAIAASCYQGGHTEYFKYMVDQLREQGRTDIRVFGGGGGVITPEEIDELHAYGVTRIYSPYDGQVIGLQGIIDDMIKLASYDVCAVTPQDLTDIKTGDVKALARFLTALENSRIDPAVLSELSQQAAQLEKVPVLGITGTGGAGKSSLTDELLWRFRADKSDRKIALLAIDPTKRKTGGALLGDRIRMNALPGSAIYMRSFATRGAQQEVIPSLDSMIAACKRAGFEMVVVETPGIGQGDSTLTSYVDVSMYVMTPEFGAASQLEKIDMLDFADVIAINKCDRQGALDAIRDVRKQYQRNHQLFSEELDAMPVYGTVASHFNDEGVTALYHGVLEQFNQRQLGSWQSQLAIPSVKISQKPHAIVPGERIRYLAEIAATVRSYKSDTAVQAELVRKSQQLRAVVEILAEKQEDATILQGIIKDNDKQITAESKELLARWPQLQEDYSGDELTVTIRDKKIVNRITTETLSGLKMPKVALPKYVDQGEILTWLRLENVPGHFPYTAGVFPFKREDENPTRMFAGEGDPFRTNARFKLLAEGHQATRLSTAFDSVTLYGSDPAERLDIYGKVGNSGVSIATLDDMEVLYSGFDLCDPTTSVSMTINGPAPTLLAMYFNTAIDQQVEKFKSEQGREPKADELTALKSQTLQTVRGTVQADILKEDQGQNTCIFSTEFSLKMMGDIQAYFTENNIRNFYSVSISGYHIAEAGANPISQLAFTLANGFTYVEYYLARGMDIDEFAPNLAFFFSNGMDAEYSVMGRVARRIWAVAMRERYGANSRSQKLKYHLQTSGRSLHAQEMDFNDIRTTLEALIASYDNCNSLHTNAYDEAVTTPTTASVRRAQAIQLIINREWGLSKNENPNQGSFILEELTELVEEAVLKEFERISERGGVLGAMETGYQRSKIQEESLYYEHKKHDGSLPLIGVNAFINPEAVEEEEVIELSRSTDAEKQSQLKRLRDFQQRHKDTSGPMLQRLQDAVRADENVFAVLMEAVRVCSLGQITQALYSVGGQYRRNM